MNLNPRKPPPIEADLSELTTFIERALFILQFCSDQNGLLPLPAMKLLLDFLPEFQRRHTPLKFICDYLVQLGLLDNANNESTPRIRLDVYEVTIQMVNNPRPVAEQPVDFEPEEDIANDCSQALAKLQAGAEDFNDSFKQLAPKQLLIPLREIVDFETPNDVITLLKKLDVYRVVTIDGGLRCLVESSTRRLSLAELRQAQPLVVWPMATLLASRPVRSAESMSVDDIVRRLIAACEKCGERLKKEQVANTRLTQQVEVEQIKAQQLEKRVQALELVLAKVQHQVGTDLVSRLLAEHNIRFE